MSTKFSLQILGAFLASNLSYASLTWAGPTSLVGVYETESSQYWQIETDSSGLSNIVAYPCPKNTFVSSKAECAPQGKIMMATRDFNRFVRMVASTFAIRHPGQSLKEISSSDLASLRNSPDPAQTEEAIAKMKEQILKLDLAIQTDPDSEQSVKIQAQKKNQLASMIARSEKLSLVDLTLSQLSESILEMLEHDDPSTHQSHYYSGNLMQGTLLHEVMSKLTTSRTSLNRIFIYNTKPGKNNFLKLNVQGWTNQLWTKNKFMGNFADGQAEECETLVNLIRDRQANGTW